MLERDIAGSWSDGEGQAVGNARREPACRCRLAAALIESNNALEGGVEDDEGCLATGTRGGQSSGNRDARVCQRREELLVLYLMKPDSLVVSARGDRTVVTQRVDGRPGIW